MMGCEGTFTKTTRSGETVYSCCFGSAPNRKVGSDGSLTAGWIGAGVSPE